MKEVHKEFRVFNPFNWDQPRIFRWYQLTTIEFSGIEIIHRQPDLFSYQERVSTYRLRRRYRKEIREGVDKQPVQTWKSLIRELEESY